MDFENIKQKYPLLILENYNNINIKNLIPIDKKLIDKIIPDYYLCHYFHDYDTNISKNDSDILIELNKEDTYIILNNKWSHHFYHFIIEELLSIEIYLKYFSKCKLICNKTYSESPYFKLILEHLNLSNKLLVTENNVIYNGNFIYLFLLPKHNFWINKLNLNNDCVWLYKDDKTILNRLIEVANNKYKDKVDTYDRIWISRRNLNIETYHHKRFCLNINDIADTILQNNFKEFHFGTSEIDLLLQIYYVNNAKIIFAENGSAFVNILFMNNNTKWITNNTIGDVLIDNIVKNLCEIFNVKLYMIMNSILDNNDKYANFHVIYNRPYKIDNIDDFNLFFNNSIIS